MTLRQKLARVVVTPLAVDSGDHVPWRAWLVQYPVFGDGSGTRSRIVFSARAAKRERAWARATIKRNHGSVGP